MTDPQPIPTYVTLPSEDFNEINNAAKDYTPTAPGDFVGRTLQTTFFFGATAGAIAAVTWGYVKATDWLEERRFQRETRNRMAHNAMHTPDPS